VAIGAGDLAIATLSAEKPRVTSASDTPGAAALSSNLRGALWMLASAACFTAMTTLVKYLGGDYPAALQAFYRQLAGFVILVPMIIRRRSAAFATRRPGILFFRAGAGTLANILSFYAYQKMPLADGNALSFTRTLWVVPLAAFVLRERVGPLRLVAALVGFLGVLVMVRPGAGAHLAIGLPAVAMLASSLLYALTITGMKVVTRDTASSVLLVWSAALGMLLALPGAFIAWRWPTPLDLALLFAMGGIGTLNQWCYIKGMAIGDATAMAPIDYVRLVFATMVGLALFHEVPGVWTLAGASIVVASTLVITWREAQLARRPFATGTKA